MNPSAIKTGRHHRNLHLTLSHLIIRHRAKNHLGIGVDILGNNIRRFIDLEHRHVTRAGNIEEDAARTVDRKIKKRTIDRRARRFDRSVLTRGDSDSHKSAPAIFHNGAHIGKVHIDDTRLRNEIRNTLHALPEHVVHNTERIDERCFTINNRKKLIIWDRNERVDTLLHILERLFRDRSTLGALKGKRLCDDANRKRTDLFGGFGDNRRRTRSGTPAQTTGDKHHIRTLQNFLNLITIFFRRLTTDLRVHTGAKTLGEIFPNVNFFART